MTCVQVPTDHPPRLTAGPRPREVEAAGLPTGMPAYRYRHVGSRSRTDPPAQVTRSRPAGGEATTSRSSVPTASATWARHPLRPRPRVRPRQPTRQAGAPGWGNRGDTPEPATRRRSGARSIRPLSGRHGILRGDAMRERTRVDPHATKRASAARMASDRPSRACEWQRPGPPAPRPSSRPPPPASAPPRARDGHAPGASSRRRPSRPRPHRTTSGSAPRSPRPSRITKILERGRPPQDLWADLANPPQPTPPPVHQPDADGRTLARRAASVRPLRGKRSPVRSRADRVLRAGGEGHPKGADVARERPGQRRPQREPRASGRSARTTPVVAAGGRHRARRGTSKGALAGDGAVTAPDGRPPRGAMAEVTSPTPRGCRSVGPPQRGRALRFRGLW